MQGIKVRIAVAQAAGQKWVVSKGIWRAGNSLMPSTSECVLGLDASEDIAPNCRIFDKDIGVASPDIDIGLG